MASGVSRGVLSSLRPSAIPGRLGSKMSYCTATGTKSDSELLLHTQSNPKVIKEEGKEILLTFISMDRWGDSIHMGVGVKTARQCRLQGDTKERYQTITWRLKQVQLSDTSV
ncbi:hypothetical protein Bbelb_058660 [Branchiostoma belcheri]|nr:hypothetical protein Bbelb_058660 [Branchiostoma belcheri]